MKTTRLRLLCSLACLASFGAQAGTASAAACRSHYDVAAYVWPSYHPDDRARLFWPDGIGEWQTVIAAQREGIMQAGRTPLWGYVNEADPKVNEMQINAAADHGVNVFIFDWYWYDNMPFLEGQLDDGFLKARNVNRMKFYVMWANHDVTLAWDRRNADDAFHGRNKALVWNGGVDRASFERAADRLITRYFKNPSYYRIDGKPVLMIYDVDRLVNGLGGLEQARDAMRWFRARVKQAGFPGVQMQVALRALDADDIKVGDTSYKYLDVVRDLGFDSGTHYQYAHMESMAGRDYADTVAGATKMYAQFTDSYSFLHYYPHVSIGWNPDPRVKVHLHGEVRGDTPARFRQGLLDAKAYVDAHPGAAPLITINSWNEWTEGSYLEPDHRTGWGNLDAVKDVFGPDDRGAGCRAP